MSEQATLWDIPSVTGSPALESGATLLGSPDGRMTERSGPEAAPAQDSRARAKGEGLTTLVTSGLTGIPSSASAALQSSLESRLMTLLDSAGSTLFVETWKRRVTPLRRRYWEHTARAPLTSGSGCTSVPIDSLPTPMAGTPAQNGNSAAGNNDYSRKIVELATCATPRSEDSQCAGAHRGTPDTLHAQANLSAVASPKSRDFKSASASAEFLAEQMAHPRGKDLNVQATYFFPVATPTCPAPHDSDQTAGKGRPRKGYGEDLAIQANQYDPGVDPDGSTRSRLDQLPRQAQLAATGLIATGGTEETKSIGQLDPDYSRWLQGLPPVWCKLRGYGDAIVAPVAQIFIQAYLEIEHSTNERKIEA